MNREHQYLRTINPIASRPAAGHHGTTPLVQPPSAPAATQFVGRDYGAVTGEGAGSATEHRFRELVRQWKEAVQYVSSATQMVTHPAYQQIIGLGRPALPLLLDELRRDPDHWFWALRAITGENPVAEADAGKLGPMTAAWLRWAQEHGY